MAKKRTFCPRTNNRKNCKEIKRIFLESDRIFGVVRMHYALKRELNWNINIKAIRRLMRNMSLTPEIRRKRPNWVKNTPVHTAEKSN
ncbi:IS3 family transposase [Enterococcus wangshanyuanii]|uniref:IS3 family transposase n=1 Tax=Enterococcus wangshanyuanii TaxID=2005703 RepID=UPI000B4A7264